MQSDWNAITGDALILNKPTIPSGNQIIDWTVTGAGTIHATNYTNTTYSVGDGGLTQKNFTTDLNTKLDAIESGADVTDATNVSAAGAVMKSGIETITGNKTFSGVTTFSGGFGSSSSVITTSTDLPSAGTYIINISVASQTIKLPALSKGSIITLYSGGSEDYNLTGVDGITSLNGTTISNGDLKILVSTTSTVVCICTVLDTTWVAYVNGTDTAPA